MTTTTAITTQYEVGQEVAVGQKSYDFSIRLGKFKIQAIAKVSKMGQVTLDDGQRFTKDGSQIGGSGWKRFLRPVNDEIQASVVAKSGE